MKFLSVILFLIVASCKHPESESFDRYNVETPKQVNTTRSNFSTHQQLPEMDRNVIRMESENGVRYVWVEINGLKLRFIFDTGASSICISPAEVAVLFRQGTLTQEDVISSEYFQDATGRISVGTKINLRSIKIGTFYLTNVEATVIDNVDAPLLLGQSVLENFGSIEIDNINSEIILK
jgi:aspartyl protease family protein